MAQFPFKDFITTWKDGTNKALKTKGESQLMGEDPDGSLIPIKVDSEGKVLTNTQLTGSNMEYYGQSLNDRPTASEVKIGSTFSIVNDNLDTWISDGVEWRVF